MAEEIFGLVMPKFGMVMTEGLISNWYVGEGDPVSEGDDLVDIETEKVANTYQSPRAGVLRRKLVLEGDTLAVGGLFGVIADESVQESEIEGYVQAFNAQFVSTQSQESLDGPEKIALPSGFVRFLKRGEGPGIPMLLVHGFSGDLNSWLLNQEALADSRNVYALDIPGHGGTAAPSALSSIDDLARAVEEFLDAQSLDRVHLVGHSLGGGICAKVAFKLPEKVASLTLIAPIGLGEEINSQFISGMLTAERRNEMKTVLESLFSDPELVSRDMVKNALQSKRIDGAVDSLRQIAERCSGIDRQIVSIRDELSSSSIPVQLIWGSHDQIIPFEHSANLPVQIKVHHFADVGHMPQMERPNEVNRLIAQFAAENDK